MHGFFTKLDLWPRDLGRSPKIIIVSTIPFWPKRNGVFRKGNDIHTYIYIFIALRIRWQRQLVQHQHQHHWYIIMGGTNQNPLLSIMFNKTTLLSYRFNDHWRPTSLYIDNQCTRSEQQTVTRFRLRHFPWRNTSIHSIILSDITLH